MVDEPRACGRTRLRRPAALSGEGLLRSLRGAELHRIGAVAVAERRGVDLLELDLAGQYLDFPRVLLGHSGVELGHYLSGEQLEALADVLVCVFAGLVHQDDLVDMRGRE